MNWEDVKEEVHKAHALREQFNPYPPQWDDLYHIWENVCEVQPSTMIEYGPGLSTIVMRCACPSASFLSLDADPYWYSINKQTIEPFIPQGGHFRLLFSAVETDPAGAIRYIFHPLRQAEFVYVDGPELLHRHKWVSNLYDLLPFPRRVIIDGREDQSAISANLISEKRAIVHNRDRFRTTIYTVEDALEKGLVEPGDAEAA